jgi:hypothetical protein
MSDPTPESVAEHVKRVGPSNHSQLTAFWMQLSGPRDDFAIRLRKLLTESDVIVLVVRSGGFDNPNSLMQDLARLLDSHRPEFLEFVTARGSVPSKIGLVLLARSELRIPQTSSPVLWPEWVPGVGRLETSCYIQDVSRAIAVALDSHELALNRLNRAAYDLDVAILRRLQAVHLKKPNAHSMFWNVASHRDDQQGFSGLLKSVSSALSTEGTISSYRPTGRGARSICGRLWVRFQKLDSRARDSFALGLANALDISDTDIAANNSSLFSVLSRSSPTAQDAGAAEQLARDILVTNATACQLITCAAHAGDYGQYPLVLLRSVVDEVHRGLIRIEASLNTLPPPTY